VDRRELKSVTENASETRLVLRTYERKASISNKAGILFRTTTYMYFAFALENACMNFGYAVQNNNILYLLTNSRNRRFGGLVSKQPFNCAINDQEKKDDKLQRIIVWQHSTMFKRRP